MGPLALLLTSAICMGTPVHQSEGVLSVRAGPFTGYVTSYDNVGGRFALRVGPNRTNTGLSQKIPWFVAPGADVTDTLLVTGKALSLPPRTFQQTLISSRVGQRTVFPSILSPPSVGCWRLTFTSGRTTAALAVRVRPRP